MYTASSPSQCAEALAWHLDKCQRGTSEPLVLMLLDLHTYAAGQAAERAVGLLEQALADHLPQVAFIRTATLLHR